MALEQDYKLCRECKGTGQDDSGDSCPNCDGTGYVEYVRHKPEKAKSKE